MLFVLFVVKIVVKAMKKVLENRAQE